MLEGPGKSRAGQVLQDPGCTACCCSSAMGQGVLYLLQYLLFSVLLAWCWRGALEQQEEERESLVRHRAALGLLG